MILKLLSLVDTKKLKNLDDFVSDFTNHDNKIFTKYLITLV